MRRKENMSGGERERERGAKLKKRRRQKSRKKQTDHVKTILQSGRGPNGHTKEVQREMENEV